MRKRIVWIKTSVFQPWKECFTAATHPLDDRRIQAEVQRSFVRLNDAAEHENTVIPWNDEDDLIRVMDSVDCDCH